MKDKPGFRPAGARLLKSTIDTLRPILPGIQVLDLYSGAGRFGLAALNEAAAHCVFVEKDRELCNALRATLTKQKLADRAQVICEDVGRFLARPQRAEIVFADPPFIAWENQKNQELWNRLASLGARQIVVKFPARLEFPSEFANYGLVKQTSFGESVVLYYEDTALS